MAGEGDWRRSSWSATFNSYGFVLSSRCRKNLAAMGFWADAGAVVTVNVRRVARAIIRFVFMFIFIPEIDKANIVILFTRKIIS